jgi:antitoxin (DNA-binding transcriptional repressor) of toxin-antitoxin stability system
MNSNDYGPVPLSRIKAESDEILAALAAGRRVLISKQGHVVAAMTPPTEGP